MKTIFGRRCREFEEHLTTASSSSYKYKNSHGNFRIFSGAVVEELE
jgi:hypothetical protein